MELSDLGKTNMEIERRWLLSNEALEQIKASYPMLDESISRRVYPFTTDSRVMEIIHSDGEAEYTLTIKGSGTIAREETEILIEKDRAEACFDLYRDKAIVRKYRKFYLGGYNLEIATVDNTFNIAEIEFDSVEAADSYTLPKNIEQFFNNEVTHCESSKMYEYWKMVRMGNMTIAQYIKTLENR